MSEADDVSVIAFRVSTPVDVIVQSGEERETVIATVNESSRRDSVAIKIPNSSFTMSHLTTWFVRV